MENRLDKLFKDQLSRHEEEPSPKAWDRIHGQLVSKRRKVWGKRLAIAASILLFATVGFFGYRSLNELTIKNDQFVSKSIDTNRITKDQRNREMGISDKKESNEIKKGDNIETGEPQEAITEMESVDKIAKIPGTTVLPVVKIEDRMPIVTKAITDKHEIPNTIIIEVQEEIIEARLLPEQVVDTTPAEIIGMDKSQEIREITKPKKTYPRITIIYKADKNSELVTSGKKTLMDKGINKITRFSDEHLLTADRKTKLRNTKEDLLALNFGKLLNKSN